MNKNIIQKKTPQNYHGPSVPNMILSYQAFYITKFFWITSKIFHLEITILAVAELIEKVEEIKTNTRTWGCGISRFRVMALWSGRGGHKFLFSTGQTFCQKLLFHIVAMSGLKRFRIVTHCYPVSFSIKTLFCKTNNIENQTWDKTK